MPLLPVSDERKNSYSLHLDLGSIQGESQSALHSQEIEISSFSFGATNSAVRSAAGTSKGGKPTVSEITVIKHIDKASPPMLNALLTNQLIKSAKITMSKSTGGGKPEDFVTITLTGVYITSHHMTHSHDFPEHQRGLETVTLNFQKVSIDYKVQLASGLLVGATSASYDLTQGS
jgi:type VI secretion system secreted protein Hcp